ncbi:hypothetical protein PCIT_b0602 [Pseudoalteromonas citrea]|uniref:Uncharacterized protein n=2 Tax=Pseudoalteromonas citrea TaxID=43655 RepID=A0AAD4FQ02_9GAMM|nr:hypothetical protein [Pseudoalteromonas citrea]KAF7764566.1 hypothetical protein PCIT_b0602 [Pseudoalteromonas citrea]
MYGNKRRLKQRGLTRDNVQATPYLIEVLSELQRAPHKVEIIKRNCDYYKTQIHLKRGFLTAIERIELVLVIDHDIERIRQQILANDYIGNRIRRYPLLFKGILD